MNPEEIDIMNEQRFEKAKNTYEKFCTFFKTGNCSICEKSISSCDGGSPCLHWLLYPSGVKKKYFNSFFKKFDFFQVNSYLMWASYQEGKSTKINNLESEKSQNKIWETTISYKNIVWSVTCSNTDFLGHKNSRANFPHYHFSMEVNQQPFISFSDYHLKLTKEDILRIKAHNTPYENVIHFWYVPGMEEIFRLEPEELLDSLKVAENEGSAPFNITSAFEMDGGIHGEDIHKAIMKSKETGLSMAKYLSEIPHIKMKAIISPGEGVPELKKKLSRSQKRNIKNEKQD